MRKPNDLSRSLSVLNRNSTLIAVIEMSQSSWLIAGIVPGVERQPLKKLAVDESALLKILHRWREEAEKAGHKIERIAVAFEAGRDGFWLARWLRARARAPRQMASALSESAPAIAPARSRPSPRSNCRDDYNGSELAQRNSQISGVVCWRTNTGNRPDQ